MFTLFKTICTTDWKARPCHSLIKLGSEFLTEGDELPELVRLQNADIAAWQQRDIVADREIAIADGEEPKPVSSVWADNYRWEMDQSPGEKEAAIPWRSFAGRNDDGDRWSIAYHIIEDN